MPGVFRDTRLDGDIEALVSKYPSLQKDVGYIENLLRDGRFPSTRCREFEPDWAWRTEVHISDFGGADAEDRCTLIYERDGDTCDLLLIYDNDAQEYEEMIVEIRSRRS